MLLITATVLHSPRQPRCRTGLGAMTGQPPYVPMECNPTIRWQAQFDCCFRRFLKVHESNSGNLCDSPVASHFYHLRLLASLLGWYERPCHLPFAHIPCQCSQFFLLGEKEKSLSLDDGMACENCSSSQSYLPRLKSTSTSCGLVLREQPCSAIKTESGLCEWW